MNLILASGSPRRRELLSLYTTNFTVCVSDFDESAVQAATPAQLVLPLQYGQPYGGFDFGYAFSDLQGEQQL